MIRECSNIFNVLVLILLFYVQDGLAVRITNLAVPPMVLNGSLPSLVLDCVYELDRASNDSDPGLVVKWYHNRAHLPVYQWIPGYPPQAFGILRGNVNLHYVASEEAVMRHRAIQLSRPRAELSGEYTCKVTTWSGVATDTKRMTIYAPIKFMTLVSTRSPTDVNRMNVTCKVTGVYPEPEINIYVQGSKEDREELRGVQVTKTLTDGVFSIRATRQLDDRQIPAQCIIYCQLTLPHTTYAVSEKIPHIRGASSDSSMPVFPRNDKLIGRSLRCHTSSACRCVLCSTSLSIPIIFALLRWVMR